MNKNIAKPPRHRDTEIQRHRDTEMQRYADTAIPIPSYRETEIPRHRDTKTEVRYTYPDKKRAGDYPRSSKDNPKTAQDGPIMAPSALKVASLRA